jgi:hypothetical protein
MSAPRHTHHAERIAAGSYVLPSARRLHLDLERERPGWVSATRTRATRRGPVAVSTAEAVQLVGADLAPLVLADTRRAVRQLHGRAEAEAAAMLAAELAEADRRATLRVALASRRPRRLPRVRTLGRLLGTLTAFLALMGAGTAASADVRSTAAWSVRLAPRAWATIPTRVCGGARPSDVEAWSVRTGRRVGDDRLFLGVRPERIVGSSYRAPVRAFVWCDPGTGHGLRERRAVPAVPWPMVRVLAVAAEVRS